MTAGAPTGFVTGADEVKIAFWRSGPESGRPLVLVHGTTSSHQTFDELVPHAAAERPTYVYDRRGRGESGDGPATVPYRVDLESRDAAAVFDEVARREGSPVDVLAHSYGGFVALGAVPGTGSVRALAVYSPGFGAAYPDGALERVEEAIADQDADQALQVVFRDLIGMPQEDIDVLRRSPVWAVRTALAWSVPRECREDAAFLASHESLLRAITVPVAIVTGATNTAEKREIASRLAGLIPGARLVELAGEGHAAHHSAPAALLAAASELFQSV